MVVYVTFLRDVACQKLLNSANVSQSYSQNNTGTVFLRHGVETLIVSSRRTLLYQRAAGGRHGHHLEGIAGLFFE